MQQTHLHFPVYAVLISSCATLTAQNGATTWTSLESRRSHAMASDGNRVVLFAGETVAPGGGGELLGDFHGFNQTWSSIPPGAYVPQPRTGHAMAGLPGGPGGVVIFGGRVIDPRPPHATRVPIALTEVMTGNDVGRVVGAVEPSPRSGHAMVTMSVNGVNTVLMFGGFSGLSNLNDTWLFNPANRQWTQVQANGPMSTRQGHVMAFHPGDGATQQPVVYMFGGAPLNNDLWEFSHATQTWAQKFPTNSLPAVRTDAAMAFVPILGRIVLFGGSSFGVPQNDTWSYDRSTNAWQQHPALTPPPARSGHAMAIDNTGRRLIMVGGTDTTNQPLPGTFEWDGLTLQWSQLLPPPGSRDGAAITFPSPMRSDQHVMFGGRSTVTGADLGDTWELQGINWRQRVASVQPAPRSDAGLAHDSARGLTVLYGGRSQASGDLGDTWEWNGVNWLQRNPTASPPAAGGTQPVFDPVRNVTWMLVGSDMWSFDGTTWTNARPFLPPLQDPFRAAWDSNRSRLVMFGGGASPTANDTWEWDGSVWRQLNPPTAPQLRYAFQMVFDPVRQRTLVSSGEDNVGPCPCRRNDTWTWDGAMWQSAANGPALAASGVAFDVARGVSVVFGGKTDPGSFAGNGTYEWDGLSWTTRQLPLSPPPRMSMAMAYDPTLQRIIVFSGQDNHGTTAVNWPDTWEYDGASWQQMFPIVSPAPRSDASSVFDVRTGKVMVHSGIDTTTTRFFETWLYSDLGNGSRNWIPQASPASVFFRWVFSTGTRTLAFEQSMQMWEWDGTSWTRLETAPAARVNYGAVFDTRRNRVIVFGGMSSNIRGTATFFNDTWSWNGAAWERLRPTNPPSPRGFVSLAYDEARDRVILHSGADATIVHRDTWEFDGTNWLLRAPANTPPPSFGHELSYDRARRVTIAFGGFGTFDYGPVRPAIATAFGTGCPTSASVPPTAPLELVVPPWAGPWLGETFEVQFRHRPAGTLAIAAWGFSNTVSPLGPLPLTLGAFGSPNCSLLTSADLYEIRPNTPTLTQPIPASTSLLSVHMFFQAGFFDAGQPGAPIVTSNAVETVIGQK